MRQIQRSKHPIYSHILRLRPNINKKFAFKLSNLMYKYSRKYKINPHISVAIVKQETNIRNIHRQGRVLIVNNDGTYMVIRGYTDLGLFQFHIGTILAYDMNIKRLKTDLEYAVDQHFKLLRKKIIMCKHLKDAAWSCYHSTNELHRQTYERMVRRYL